MENEIRTIHVKEATKRRLEAHGKYGDSQDTILNRVLDQAENYRALMGKHKPKHASPKATEGATGATA